MLSSLLKYHSVRESLEEFLEANNYDKLNEVINSLDVKDIGPVIQKLSLENLQRLVNIFPHLVRYELFQNFSSDLQNDILNVISSENLKKVMKKLSYDELFKVYACLSVENQKKLLSFAEMKEAGAIHIKKKYIEFEIGDILSLNYLVIPLFWSVKKAKELIAKDPRYYNCNYKILITNEKLEIIGHIVISELLVAKDNALLNDIVNFNIDSVNINGCGIATLMQKISAHNLDFVVILDPQNKLIGTVSASDILVKAQKNLLKRNDESSEDITFIEHSAKYFPVNFFAALCASVVYLVSYFMNRTNTDNLLPFISVLPISFAYTMHKILGNFKNTDFSWKIFAKPFCATCANAVIISTLVLGAVISLEGFSKGILSLISVFSNILMAFIIMIGAKLLNLKNNCTVCSSWEFLMPVILLINLLSLVLICILY